MDYLHHLPRLLLGRIWPPERIVMGLRVCRWLHTELTAAAPHAVLKATENVDTTTPADLVKTLYAFRKCRVLLHWDSPTNRDTVVAGVSVAVSLGCTESIVHVDVGESKLGAKRAAALFQVASVLTTRPSRFIYRVARLISQPPHSCPFAMCGRDIGCTAPRLWGSAARLKRSTSRRSDCVITAQVCCRFRVQRCGFWRQH